MDRSWTNFRTFFMHFHIKYTWKKSETMPKKRVLHPQSIWNIEAVTNSFNQVGAKQSHIIRMYKYVS